ncbi:hypothetical protein JHN55_06900 [Streptomyces sp. MBT56]|uniref:hypothetical protein n=1 Tax=unclassified Streptomyces TaxID=2593676 RepID=UPI00190B6140|nr:MULTISPECIES: hypothetical protein [unclassified Streptomyces]MBK3556266.1 hypothetical protein [Streptomyces sp. MBT56]MBK3601267.1 hypothetical protein [Streptomyces sp. MBT54]MBK3619289.1 hypothetical protein [Streptomyces sp. MBT98]MBK6046896.1 hypothetical protein [Streptomyces sp. MBT55]
MKPPSHHVVRCRRCHAPIVWCLTTANGKRQPVNATPDAAGNVAVTNGADGALYVRGLTKAHPEPTQSEWRGRPHHSTCPFPPSARSSAPTARAVRGVRPVPWQR